METEVLRSWSLPPGSVALPAGVNGSDLRFLRLGANRSEVAVAGTAPEGELWLATDLWERLTVPYSGIRLKLRRTDPDELELGPVLAILYAGRAAAYSAHWADERAFDYYRRLKGAPGLFAFGFDESIDWDRGTMDGYLLDNRPGHEGRVIRSTYPIPAVVRLAWSIRREVIARLRERTGERTFNWVRNMSKRQFYDLLREDPVVREHLPETRLHLTPVDLMAMLARHDVVFIKHVFGIKGQGSARIRRTADGFEVRHMDQGRLVEVHFPDLTDLAPYVRRVVGEGRCIVQEGIPLTGAEGRALDFRVLVVRDAEGGWRCPVVTAIVAPDDKVVFTNLANGATDEDMLESLQRHHGMTAEAANRCGGQMVALCLAAAKALEGPFHPLGILGFDVVVEAGSHRLWLLEANVVPGWGYPEGLEQELTASQADYALLLSGFPMEERDRLPR